MPRDASAPDRPGGGDGGSARERLLEAAVAHLAGHGLGELSLRRLATALGTSHRMLIYHFGSKDGLLVAVVRTVEERQRTMLAELAADTTLPPREQARRMWRRLSDPALAPHVRLFFELAGQALQGREPVAALLDGLVEPWLEPLTGLARRSGMPERVARPHARVALAAARGLLLDLLATDDRAAVDQAAELLISGYADDR